MQVCLINMGAGAASALRNHLDAEQWNALEPVKGRRELVAILIPRFRPVVTCTSRFSQLHGQSSLQTASSDDDHEQLIPDDEFEHALGHICAIRNDVHGHSA